jgi:hypothetical protein
LSLPSSRSTLGISKTNVSFRTSSNFSNYSTSSSVGGSVISSCLNLLCGNPLSLRLSSLSVDTDLVLSFFCGLVLAMFCLSYWMRRFSLWPGSSSSTYSLYCL